MRHILTIALSIFVLSGCMAEWPSNRTGPRFNEGPNLQPFYDSNPGAIAPPPPPPPPPLH